MKYKAKWTPEPIRTLEEKNFLPLPEFEHGTVGIVCSLYILFPAALKTVCQLSGPLDIIPTVGVKFPVIRQHRNCSSLLHRPVLSQDFG
jgi:hypothetical protein